VFDNAGQEADALISRIIAENSNKSTEGDKE
jgi:hypothetical protein